MNTEHCPCGMNLLPEEGQPTPYGLTWRTVHRDRHLAMFPGADMVTRANLELLIADAAAKDEGLAV